ncbi:MAG TPA: hypothetical protein VJI98_00120 [Candidatus Nanoarchaeia archaeon]|nr:hypothetical protein [Candidatus Nanoarchaeia archaeon]
MDNCTYNKAKLLHELSKITGFVKTHAIKDAKGRHTKCKSYLEDLYQDLAKHMRYLQEAL